jgi:hypothetical protein
VSFRVHLALFSDTGMKLAILLSGHVRTPEYAERNVRQLKIRFPYADVFMHTWAISEMSSPTHREPSKKIIELENDYLARIPSKRLLVEQQELVAIPDDILQSIHDLPVSMQSAALGCFWMLYGIQMSTKLMQSYSIEVGIKYDYVLRYRYDLIVDSLDELEKDITSILCKSKSMIMTTNTNWWPFGSYSDVVWISTNENHLALMGYLKANLDMEIRRFRTCSIFLPELILTKVIQSLNIKLIPSNGIYSLNRHDRMERVSRLHGNWCRDIDTLVLCWTHLKVGFKRDGIWVREDDDFLRIEWKNNSFLFLRSLNLTRFFYVIYSLYKVIKSKTKTALNIFKT